MQRFTRRYTVGQAFQPDTPRTSVRLESLTYRTASRRSLRHAMTLVELLVVLTILALLTTVAITSSDVLLGQGRYDVTIRSLQEIQDAVLGPANARQPDGTVVVSGFLADVGRWPSSLAELWSKPNGLATFAISQPSSDDLDIWVGAGWRGPYLRLPIGEQSLPSDQQALRDGWGKEITIQCPGLPDGSPDFRVVSPGPDGVVDIPSAKSTSALTASDIRDDIWLSLSRPLATVSGTVTVVDSSGNRTNPPDSVTVRFYGPGVESTPISCTPTDDGFSYSIPKAVAPGPHFVRAYLTVSGVTKKSPIVRFVQSDVIHLEIRYP